MSTLVFAGTYAGAGEPGIHALDLDEATGRLAALGSTAGIVDPSFLAVDGGRRVLYAISEGGDTLAAFAFEPGSGRLTSLGIQPTGSAGPCYVSLDATGAAALVASYGGGAVTLFPLAPDGTPRPATCRIQHEGGSIDPERQQGPHPHSIVADPGNRFALVPDLGADRIVLYALDAAASRLEPIPGSVTTKRGAGPRHLAFHPDGRYFFVSNELDSTVTMYGYDAESGSASALHTLSTVPESFQGRNYPADIHVHPGGRFVYVSNRGYDTIALFEVDASLGRLTAAGQEPTQGEWPRNFAIAPGGGLLLAANQNSGSIVSFAIDRDTGALDPTGDVIQVPHPACVVCVP
jgi:6-phosphogluconolactonase